MSELFKTLEELVNRTTHGSKTFTQGFLVRVLKISRGEASEILSLKRPIGTKVTEALIQYFEIKDTQNFRRLVLRHNLSLRLSKSKTVNSVVLKEPDFLTLSSKVHVSLMALSKTKNFKCEPKAIALALGEDVAVVKAALSDFKRVGILRVTKSGPVFVDSYESTPNVSSQGSRKINREMLEFLRERMDQSVLHSDTHLLRIRKADLPALKELISDLQKKVTDLLENQEANTIYGFALQFVPFSK